MSNINVNGDNNRTAGRDYHEHRGPSICPSCEVRCLTPGRQWCRHCENEYNEVQRQKAIRRATRERLLFWLRLSLIPLVISTLFLLYAGKEYSAFNSFTLLASLFVSVIINNALKNYPPDE